jgi:hypothetical protein
MAFELVVIDDLEVFETSSVIKRDETDRSAVAVRADPSFKKDGGQGGEILALAVAGVKLADGNGFGLHTG